jgi:hypothetical protein
MTTVNTTSVARRAIAGGATSKPIRRKTRAASTARVRQRFGFQSRKSQDSVLQSWAEPYQRSLRSSWVTDLVDPLPFARDTYAAITAVGVGAAPASLLPRPRRTRHRQERRLLVASQRRPRSGGLTRRSSRNSRSLSNFRTTSRWALSMVARCQLPGWSRVRGICGQRRVPTPPQLYERERWPPGDLTPLVGCGDAAGDGHLLAKSDDVIAERLEEWLPEVLGI